MKREGSLSNLSILSVLEYQLIRLVLHNLDNKMDTFSFYSGFTTIFTLIATVNNIASFIYIKRTFDTKQCLAHILCLDSILTLVSGIVSVVAISMIGCGIELNNLSCFLFMVGTGKTVYTSPVCNFMVSYIR